MPETMDQHRDPEPDGDKRTSRTGNIVLLVAACLFIAAAIWLVDALLAARKADECIAAGRRNCGPTGVIFPR
ncbi:MAG TPA: hypothetical protein VNL39_06920 [Xanthobacteraceae bacterium]|nr:hypothetical protein [Xanthobacteraceae bacterium]